MHQCNCVNVICDQISQHIKIKTMNLLDREDGDTIDIDFEELYGLCENDVSCQIPNDTDFLQPTWNNDIIEDSLETIRNVLASANIPVDNREIIEKSLTTLRNAIDLPPVNSCEDTSIPPPAVLQSDDWTSAVPGDDSECYAAVTAAAAEHEDRVREALGIASQPVPELSDSLYNENFVSDRERQEQHHKDDDAHLSLWIENLTSSSMMDMDMMVDTSASLEEISCPQDLLPKVSNPCNMSSDNLLNSPACEMIMSPISPLSVPSSSSVSSVDNIIDQRYKN